MKIPPFDSLVWGSLRLAPIIIYIFKLAHYKHINNETTASSCTEIVTFACILIAEVILHKFQCLSAHTPKFVSLLVQ